jgi:hypothetical protein
MDMSASSASGAPSGLDGLTIADPVGPGNRFSTEQERPDATMRTPWRGVRIVFAPGPYGRYRGTRVIQYAVSGVGVVVNRALTAQR